MTPKVTVPELRARKQRGPKIAMLTAYDATLARLLDTGGADVLLVGDSLGMVVQGRENTLPVTLDEICYHGRAVARGTRRAHLVGDMPFMSFQLSAAQALESAGKMVKEGAFEAVKFEGGARYTEHVNAIVGAGIPVMGHLGLLPQSVHAMGGFRVQGREEGSAELLLADARALEQAGAYAIVLEGIPAEVARLITEGVGIPTIGIGAGPHCDGQVLVCYDFLGMYSDVRPKFVRRFAELGDAVVAATQGYVAAVQQSSFPTAEHSFAAKPAKAKSAAALDSPKAKNGVEDTGARPVVEGAPPSYGPATDEPS